MNRPELQQVDVMPGNCWRPVASQSDVSPVSSPPRLGSICCKGRRGGWERKTCPWSMLDSRVHHLRAARTLAELGIFLDRGSLLIRNLDRTWSWMTRIRSRHWGRTATVRLVMRPKSLIHNLAGAALHPRRLSVH